jgi:hypothetical protein
VWWRWRRRFNNLFNCYDLDDGNDRYNCDNVHDGNDRYNCDNVHHINNVDDLNNFDNRYNRFDQRRNLGIASP